MAAVNRPYFVTMAGGFAGFNNPGGRVFYVAASGWTAQGTGLAASDSNSGDSPFAPFATIQKGLDSCTAGRGDIVAVLPGVYTLTTPLTMTSADVTLCSAYPVGPRERGPVVLTAAAAYDNNFIQVDADNVKLIGLTFECGLTTVTANQEIVQINSTNTTTDIFGVHVVNCFFDHSLIAATASTTDTDLDCLRVGLDSNDRAFDTVVTGCVIKGCDQDPISISAGSTGARVENCSIYDGVASDLSRHGVSILAVGACVKDCDISIGTSSDTSGGVNVGVAAAQARVFNNNIAARGADTCAITVIATATVHSSGNWLTAVAAGNLTDYKTDNTTPSANADTGGIFAATPGATALTTPTVAGS